jgi:hypothetical protein
MEIKTKILTLILLTLVGYGCATIQAGKTTSKKKTYTEDLNTYLPEVEAVDTTAISEHNKDLIIADSSNAEVTQKLNIVLDTAASYARTTIKYIDGFTIQVYGGDNRALAKEYRMKVIRNFPETDPKTVFEQPNYKVRIGTFYTRLDAQSQFIKIKTVFPRAILIPTRIYIE